MKKNKSQSTTLGRYKITIEQTHDREKEWLIYRLRSTVDPIEQDIIKTLLDLISR